MTVLVDANTRLLCQGMTGWAGTYHTNRMIQYGTNVVAGVTPGKGGRSHLDLPVFDSVAEAVKATGANASAVFVPPAHAAKAMIEAIEAEMPLVVAVTERVPVLDMIRVREALAGSRTRLIGPNSQGVLAPGVCQIGVMATNRARAGSVGVVSRSASLTSEVISQLTAAGLGQSTTIGVGGDPIHGMGFVECLELLLADPQTQAVVLVGEIGGTEEQQAADYIRSVRPAKPIVALVVGENAPARRRMGHAGALIQDAAADVANKVRLLRDAGVIIAPSAHLVGEVMRDLVSKRAA